MAKAPAKLIYQIKITLLDSNPSVWRRVLVPSNIVLGKLHDVLQRVMGWDDSHSHHFKFDNTYYQDLRNCSDSGVKNEDLYRLNHFLKDENDVLEYEYDFGDSWRHDLELENILPFEKEKQIPICIEGKGACPPDDCGGIWGYKSLIQLKNHPNDSDDSEKKEWLESLPDPKYFNIERANARLKR